MFAGWHPSPFYSSDACPRVEGSTETSTHILKQSLFDVSTDVLTTDSSRIDPKKTGEKTPTYDNHVATSVIEQPLALAVAPAGMTMLLPIPSHQCVLVSPLLPVPQHIAFQSSDNKSTIKSFGLYKSPLSRSYECSNGYVVIGVCYAKVLVLCVRTFSGPDV